MLMETDTAGQGAATMNPNAPLARVIDHSRGSDPLLAEVLHHKVWSNAEVESGKYSLSLFVWYVGTTKRFKDLPHLQDGTDTATQAERRRAAIAEVLSQTVLQGLREHMTVSFVTTPQDFQDTLLPYKKVQPPGWGRCCWKVLRSDRTPAAKTSRTCSCRVPAATRLRVSPAC